MSELQEIEVVIAPNGEIKIHIHGVKGPKCEAITKEMEELLGGEVLERIQTDEYFQSQQEQSQQDWA